MPKLDLIQGTLDMLILRILLAGPAHGHAVAKRIEQESGDEFRIEHGSLYPALHRMEKNGWLTATWDQHPERKSQVKFYKLTPAGRKQVRQAESKWNRLTRAIARIMQPAEAS